MTGRGFYHTTDEVTQVHNRPPTEELEPASQGRPSLVVLVGTAAGRSFPLNEGPLIIGRAPDCPCWIPESDVSRRHARVESRNGQHVLIDLGSRNGSRVNGTLVQEQVLDIGDVITLGASTALIVSRHDPLNDRLLQLQKMETVGRLAGGVAHDFNDLLTVVLNNVHCLEEGGGQYDAAELRHCLGEIRHAAHRGGELTRRLLDFARFSLRQEGLVDLSALLEDAVALSQRTFDPSITVHTDIELDLMVHGDRLQLYQVVMNLLVNARDAVGQQGEIDLKARTSQDQVVVTVTDSGPGIDDATRARIFEPFFTSKEGGSGLGLSIARGIVEHHQGRILVDCPGQGTRFHVFLPLAARAPRPDRTRHATEELALAGGGVLVVDDDDLVRKSTIRLLRAMGYSTFAAKNGHEAVETYRDQMEHIDLVILDQVMPEMGGKEAFFELRRIDPEVKVVLISGFEEEGNIQELLDAGAGAFLSKPVSGSALDRTIRKLLHRNDD